MAKIMVVDDEANILELVSAVMDSEGFETITASSGQECLDKLKTEKPDLILLDMMMPGMSGRETCEKIRENPETKDIKVVFVTVARFSEVGKDILEKLNVLDYVTKPFDNADLIARVKKALD
jgi:CheY-like chemotaxis protein